MKAITLFGIRPALRSLAAAAGLVWSASVANGSDADGAPLTLDMGAIHALPPAPPPSPVPSGHRGDAVAAALAASENL